MRETDRRKELRVRDLRSFLVKIVVLLLLAALVWPTSWNEESDLTVHASRFTPHVSYAAEPVERHLANIRQLTFGRQNAEAYFSFDGAKLIFQSTNDWITGAGEGPVPSRSAGKTGLGCYQMYVMDLDSGTIRLISTGAGTTTCGYFFPGDRRVLYSSTHLVGPNCPPKPK